MKKICLSLFTVLLLASCAKNAKSNKDTDLDKKFDTYKNNFISEL
ncbi:hypothetical protein [Flavobacterium sp.]